MTRRLPPLLLLSALLLAACGGDEPPPEPKEPQGRAETRAIRNTDNIGMSGSAIADKVDAGLDANEDAARRRQDAADQAGD
jgi:hypothetical protein